MYITLLPLLPLAFSSTIHITKQQITQQLHTQLNSNPKTSHSTITTSNHNTTQQPQWETKPKPAVAPTTASALAAKLALAQTALYVIDSSTIYVFSNIADFDDAASVVLLRK
jgi:hypothetical protein